MTLSSDSRHLHRATEINLEKKRVLLSFVVVKEGSLFDLPVRVSIFFLTNCHFYRSAQISSDFRLRETRNYELYFLLLFRMCYVLLESKDLYFRVITLYEHYVRYEIEFFICYFALWLEPHAVPIGKF